MAASLTAALGIYSQTAAFAWDEGFHLLTAQLIGRGKIPYIDFCFPQTPLNAYWNAGWMRIFGDTWHTAHAVAALMTGFAVWLTADYVLRRFPVPGWRLAAAIAAVFLVGLNVVVFEFGAIGQAYGLALFLIVAAFRFTLGAVEQERLLPPATAGFLASAAANSTLLTAPVGPVLLIWMLLYSQTGSRWKKMLAFAAGGTIPCIPLAWLFVHGPRQTIFNVFEYHYFHRRLQWETAIQHDIDVMTAWINSSQAFLLGLLAIGGLVFVARASRWERPQRAEFYLCGWLAAALMLHIARAHPHFERYYLFAVPFLGIPACAGLYAAGSRLFLSDRRFWPVALVGMIAFLGLAKSLYEEREATNWYNMEAIADKVREVTPQQGMLLADELTYFLTRHPPPSGMELADSHKLDFPAPRAAELHVISRAELDRQMKSGVFDTIETWEEEDRIVALGLRRLYPHNTEVQQAHIFWH